MVWYSRVMDCDCYNGRKMLNGVLGVRIRYIKLIDILSSLTMLIFTYFYPRTSFSRVINTAESLNITRYPPSHLPSPTPEGATVPTQLADHDYHHSPQQNTTQCNSDRSPPRPISIRKYGSFPQMTRYKPNPELPVFTEDSGRK